MAPRVRVSKEDIVRAAVELLRVGGEDMLNARSIAARIGCSTQPIFSNFSNMEELRGEVIKAAEEVYRGFIAEEMATGEFPPYKASGMAYIRFAKEERELFRLLFMRRRTQEEMRNDDSALTADVMKMIREATSLDGRQASLLHLEVWTFVHGIAVMVATEYFEPERELLSRMLTDAYQGFKSRLMEV